MPVLTPNHALLAAAVALSITLYDRKVPQALIGALKGGDVPLQWSSDNGVVASGGSAPGDWGTGTSTTTGAGVGGGVDFTAAGNAVIAGGAPGGGNDWLNWCLQWVNSTRTKLGLGNPALTAPTAADACSQLRLTKGIAPKGAIVCFSGGPDGHIGLANGNNTYTSAGLIHGGLAVRDYLSNPDYLGYSP